MEPIAWGYDWAWADISAAEVRSNGGTFAIRYLGGGASLTPAERDELLHGGVSILLVMEQEDTMAEGGAARAVSAVATAEAQADSLGYPTNCPIFYADDHNDGDTSQEVAFFDKVAELARRPWGVYSGGNVCHEVSVRHPDAYTWRVETWYPAEWPAPHLEQLANTRNPAMVGVPEGSYDTNLQYKPIPMWGAATPAPADNPVHEENAMLYIAKDDGGAGRVKKNDVILTDYLSVLKVPSVNDIKNVGVAFLSGNDIEAIWADKDRSRGYK